MVNAEDIKNARRALGEQLATFCRARGLNQAKLAMLLWYSRSTIANVETGRQLAHRLFWARADQVLNANAVLVHGYEQLQMLIQLRCQEVAEVREAVRAAKFQHAIRSLTARAQGATAECTEPPATVRGGNRKKAIWFGCGALDLAAGRTNC